jgi:nicotinate phosphoribosyltransferase
LNALLTDLYELTMAAGYFAAGKQREVATFEFTIRRLPRNREFVMAAGLHRACEYLLKLRFEPEDIAFLRSLASFRNAPAPFWEYLAEFRFTGDVFAVPEGTILYAGQPVMNVHAPLIEAQLPETYVLSAVTFESLIATKAALITHAAGGREVIEFGTRRAHTPEAGVLAARAAYIGGCAGTSNVLAGRLYGVPVMGTAAHSWVMSFASEEEAFRGLQSLLGDRTVHLIDTYDPLEGARTAARIGKPLWGVRIDGGDFVEISRHVRRILDDAGLTDAKIMASGDLDENRIRDIINAGAPIDSFGVGTELATSADAPSMGTVYKLVEIQRGGAIRYAVKNAEDKSTIPGAKQLFRCEDHDVLALAHECVEDSKALLRPVMIGGRLVEPLPSVAEIRDRAQGGLANRPMGPRRTVHSAALRQLDEEVRAVHAAV